MRSLLVQIPQGSKISFSSVIHANFKHEHPSFYLLKIKLSQKRAWDLFLFLTIIHNFILYQLKHLLWFLQIKLLKFHTQN